MKPTVSDTSSSRRSGSCTRRTSGSSVTNSAFEATASSPVEHVEERRLAGVGVADQRHRRHRRLVTPLARLRPPPAHRVDLLRDHADAVPDPPAIGLELRFAGAAGADAAAEPRQRGARADQPRQQVLELRQLDLQLAFPRPRAPREDVEDELRAIDDLAVERFSMLRSCAGLSSLSKIDDVGAHFVARRRERSSLPLPRNVAGSGFARSCITRKHDVRAGGCGEAGQFVERMFGIEAARRTADQPDERGAFVRGRWTSAVRPQGASLENFSTRSHAIAPARSSRGPSRVSSTIVDGGPPGTGPGVDDCIEACGEGGSGLVRRCRRRHAGAIGAGRR